MYGSSGEEHKRDRSSEPGGEDSPIKDLSEYVFEIVIEFIKNEDYKNVRVLGAFYLRLTGSDTDLYRYLEPLYNDCRRLKQKIADGKPRRSALEEVLRRKKRKRIMSSLLMG